MVQKCKLKIELVQYWITLKIRGEVETNAELMDYLDVDDQLTTG